MSPISSSIASLNPREALQFEQVDDVPFVHVERVPVESVGVTFDRVETGVLRT